MAFLRMRIVLPTFAGVAMAAWVRPLHPTQAEWMAGVPVGDAEGTTSRETQPDSAGDALRVRHMQSLRSSLVWNAAKWTRSSKGDPARGRRYFFDGGFASDGRSSCASCHDPARAFASDKTVLGRNAPTLLGAGTLRYLNWDGSADSARAQAHGPLTNAAEMASDCAAAVERVRAVYGRERDDCAAFLADVEAYVITLMPPPTRYDLFALHATTREGAPLRQAVATLEPVLGAREMRGLDVFFGKGRCAQCHHGPLLTDGEFHNAGVPVSIDESPERAAGRIEGIRRLEANPFRCETCEGYLTLPRGRRIALGAFKTPTLRGLARTGPYMHNGAEPSLRSAIEHYVRAPEASVGDSELEPVALTRAEIDDLEAFLRVLDAP